MPKTILPKVHEPDRIPDWMQKLRMAMFNAISETDITEIMQKLVARAKDGDMKATKLILDYFAGANKPLIQNNMMIVNESKEDDEAIDAPPGSVEKINGLRRRQEQGLSLHMNGDRKEFSHG